MAKLAVITGAASGIGKATAFKFADEGIDLVLVDRSEAVNQVAKEILDMGDEVLTFVGDVTDRAFRQRVFAETVRNLGVPSILVPAAGVVRDNFAVKLDKTSGDFELYCEEWFDLVVNINLKAVAYWAMEFTRQIARKRKDLKAWDGSKEPQEGAIVFIGSICSQGNAGQIAYVATKSALVGMCQGLQQEWLRKYGIRCTIVHPGFTDTEMLKGIKPEKLAAILETIPIGRLLRAEEVAETIYNAASNESFTGSVIIDGGWRQKV